MSKKIQKEKIEERILDYRTINNGSLVMGQLIDPETKNMVKEWVITDVSKNANNILSTDKTEDEQFNY
jgi:predicted transcriptional regulator with HTH domain